MFSFETISRCLMHAFISITCGIFAGLSFIHGAVIEITSSRGAGMQLPISINLGVNGVGK